MEYKKFGNTLIARIDPGEDIVEQLLIIAGRENITLAQVNALGAVREFTIGAYSVPEQKYYQKDYSGSWEVVSLHGNVTRKDGAPYVHLHMGAGDHSGVMVGGHLNRAIIGGTCEMFITMYDGEIGRKHDPVTGLQIFDFDC